jgi:hypothetical protein
LRPVISQNEIMRIMTTGIIIRRAIGTVLGTIAFGGAGAGGAAAADIPAPQAQVQPPPPNSYPPLSPPVRNSYPPPVAYAYPPPPPPIYYYDDAPPPVMLVPRPYYLGHRFMPFYGERAYGRWGYGPYVARGYGRFAHEWGRRGW